MRKISDVIGILEERVRWVDGKKWLKIKCTKSEMMAIQAVMLSSVTLGQEM